MFKVYGIPADTTKQPFLLFIEDLGMGVAAESAHATARQTRSMYETPLAAYEFRHPDGNVERFEFDTDASGQSITE